jgi:hypothetical protein
MIDLEHDLAAIVRGAPDPPPLTRILVRARRRRRRRIGTATIAVALVLGVSAAALATARRRPSVPVGTSTVPATGITSLYGTTLDIQAPDYSLGSPRFDATVQAVDAPFPGPPSIVVTRSPPPPRPTDPAVYVTGDHRDLYAAHTDAGGDQLFGTAADWTIAITVDGLTDADRARLASLLRFHLRAGFLVVDPVPPLHLAPSIGTEFVFDGIRIDASTYPEGCPNRAPATGRTGSGFPVERVGADAFWCDPIARVRIQVEPPAPVDDLIRQLRVTRTN